jgi:hypothetical protein
MQGVLGGSQHKLHMISMHLDALLARKERLSILFE